MKHLKNIIFDLGGVIFDVDYQLTIKAFEDLGISEFTRLYSQKEQTTLFDDFEKGLINRHQFYQGIRTLCNSNLNEQQIDRAWNAMLIGLPSERIELLKNLSGIYKIYLLSNTNEIHIPVFNEYVDDKFGKGLFPSLFQKVYFSYEMGMRKPDEEIFHFVLNENRLNPNETLFIDDSPQHVEGARKAGIQALWLNNDINIFDVFEGNEFIVKKDYVS